MIYLTEPSNLTAGLWWARQITGESDLGRGPWMIVQIVGAMPFLSGRVVLSHHKPQGWQEPMDELGVIDNPNCWEFGPRIDIPSDKERVEYAPRVGEMKP